MKENEIQNLNLFNSYCVFELLYEETIKRKFGDILIFPNNWYRIMDYDTKNEILKEAISKEILIMDTDSYNNLIK
ncbi:MAG: hypothetical protein E7161_05420 [Firmicutes bacterium]|nr:hypothetical protein [Bacillota bacterium]